MGGSPQTGSTSTQYKAPDFTQAGWEQYLQNGQNLASQPIPQYGGMQVAPPSPQQNQGTQQLTAMATQGSPLYNAGQMNTLATLSGGFMDPYATTANPYMGDNPYLQNMLDASNRDITDSFSRGTAAQTDASANRSRAFGGSAYNELTAANNQALGRTLAQNESNVRGQNYNQSGQYAENQLNRASGAVQAERNRQIQSQANALGYQGADMNAIQAMMGAGQQNVQGYQQNILGQAQNYFNQGAQSPYQQQDLAGSYLSRASGAAQPSNQQTYGAAYSPWATALGLGLAGYGAFGQNR